MSGHARLDRAGRGRRRAPAMLAAAMALTLSAHGAHAQSPEQFFKGKTVKLVVTQGPGGYYDIGARLLARHWGRYIPGNPNIVVQNQTGAGGVSLANRLATGGVDTDGTTLAVLQRGIPQYAFIGFQGVRFDPLKMTWIG